MRRNLVVALLGLVLCFSAMYLAGCSQPGETMAEGHRRHLRNVSINHQEMMEDIDRVLLLQEPSRLTDKRIP